jgi:hypothetical protein
MLKIKMGSHKTFFMVLNLLQFLRFVEGEV